MTHCTMVGRRNRIREVEEVGGTILRVLLLPNGAAHIYSMCKDMDVDKTRALKRRRYKQNNEDEDEAFSRCRVVTNTQKKSTNFNSMILNVLWQ